MITFDALKMQQETDLLFFNDDTCIYRKTGDNNNYLMEQFF